MPLANLRRSSRQQSSNTHELLSLRPNAPLIAPSTVVRAQLMPKKLKTPPQVATSEVVNGRIHACDANGRPCFDLDNPERVVLRHDFRGYAPELHRGALG